LTFTDGKFKFRVTSPSKIGVLIAKPNPFHCFDYRDATVLDIGAFSGDTLILFFKWGAKRVIAYEPVPENVKLIRLNTEINNLGDRVTVIPYAVSDRNGYVEFSYDEYKESFGLKRGKYKIKLLSISIREVLSGAEDVDVAKVNCEGCEKYLLEVDDLRIPKWIIQVHHADLLAPLVNHFESKGFDVCITPCGIFFMLRAILKEQNAKIREK
jgi:FkbM family methyltransferase